MNAIKSLGRWGLPLLGLLLVLYGVVALFGLTVPAFIFGILALVSGILILLNT